MGDVEGRWWNGQWGRMGRRDIWLRATRRWVVEAREGGADNGKVLRWAFDNEESARAFVATLMDTGGPGWRDITAVSTDAVSTDAVSIDQDSRSTARPAVVSVSVIDTTTTTSE